MGNRIPYGLGRSVHSLDMSGGRKIKVPSETVHGQMQFELGQH